MNLIFMPRNNSSLFYLLLTMGSLVLGSCSKKESATSTLAETKDENTITLTREQVAFAEIALGKLEQRQLSGSIKVNGMLDVPPQNMVSISVPMGGFLKSTTLLQGSRVEKGQAIATVENLDFIQIQQDFLEANNQLQLAQAEFERQQALAKENVNAQKTLQQASAQFQSWQVKSHALTQKLKMLNIKPEAVRPESITASITLVAPIAGYVTRVNANIGKFANPGDVLFTLVDTEHLHAELTVFEKDFTKLKVGQKIRFTLVNETKERMATVYLLGREIADDRTVRIHGHLDKEDKNLLPGMYLSARIETGGTTVSVLPEAAIVTYANKNFVFVADAETQTTVTYSLAEVTLGISEQSFTEVQFVDASLAQRSIVVQGAYALLSAMKNQSEE